MATLPKTTRTLLPWLVLALLLAHWPTLLAPFQFDDVNQITENRQLDRLQNLRRTFTDPHIGFADGRSTSYRPLLYASFILEHQVAGGAAWPYRVVSLASLLLLALIAGRFTARLVQHLLPDANRERSAMTGAWTALLVVTHPLYDQAVLLASARASLWLALFGLLTLLPLLGPRRPSPVASAWMAAATLLALLSKESAVILAPLALLLALATGPGRLPSRLLATWPVLLPVALYVFFHRHWVAGAWVAEGLPPLAEALQKQLDRSSYPAQGGWALLGLLRLLVVPWGLSPVHDLPPPAGAGALLGWATWIVLPLLALYGWWRGGLRRLAGFALGWFVLAMALSLFIIVLNSPFAEHRTTLATVPALGVAAWWLSGLEGRARTFVPATVVVLLAALAAWQSWPWRSPLALWTQQVRVEPASPRAWSFLAAAREARGDLDGAASAVAEARRLSPDHPLLLGQAARIALGHGDIALARRLLARALARGETVAPLHLLMARLTSVERRPDLALRHAERAVALAPRVADNWTGLGNVHLLAGDRQAAAEAYRRALEIDPGHRLARANLGRIAPATR